MTSQWSSFDDADDTCPFFDDDPGDVYLGIPSWVPPAPNIRHLCTPATLRSGLKEVEADSRRQQLLVPADKDGGSCDPAALPKDLPLDGLIFYWGLI